MGLISSSGILGGYSPYSVWSGMTMSSSVSPGGSTSIGFMETGWTAVTSGRISVPEMYTGS